MHLRSATSRGRRWTGGSRFASSSTTRVASTTSSSTPPIDKALQADPDAFWSVRRTLKYVGSRISHREKAGTTPTPTTCTSASSPNESLARRWRRRSGERFFDPLDLDATWYQAVEKPQGPLAHGYRFAGPKLASPPIDLSAKSPVAPFRSVVTAAGGAGSIAATSADAARWGRLLYTGEVLGPAMTAQMLEGVAFTAAYSPRVPYGLGVQAFPIIGRFAVGHSGRLLGFRSAVRHLPAEKRDDRGPDEPEPGRSGSHRCGTCCRSSSSRRRHASAAPSRCDRRPADRTGA